jgi:catechol 2,3-dioxygenase
MSEVLLSQLAHVEIISPRPEESVRWFTDVLGLEETTREGQSAYLRGWGEWLHHSLVVTEGPEPALGHIGWRAYGPGDLDVIAARVVPELVVGWVDDAVGHGRALRLRTPSGHPTEVFWETETYSAPPELQTDMPLRPQRYTGRGAAARYIDHVTVNTPAMADEIAWYRATLGHRHTASITPEPGVSFFSTLTCNAIRSTHDVALVPDAPHARGRLNHIAFRVDQKLDVERAADTFLANDTPIEFGPGIHGIDEITYLYVREPGGSRIEINAGGWQNYLPDWESVDWQPHQGGTTIWKNLPMPDSMMECFPAVGGQQAEHAEEGFRTTELFAEKG